MALTETKVIDQITVTENGSILVRESTKILKDNVQVAETYHRWSFTPGSDLSEMPSNVKDIANTVWTPAVVDAYNQKIADAANTNTLIQGI